MAKLDKLLEQAKPHLEPSEQVLTAIQGTYETSILGTDTTRTGMLLATQNRVVFYAKKLGGYELESFAYGNISSFEQGKNMMGHNIKFFASGNKVQMKWISDPKAMEQFVATVKGHLGANAAAAPAAAPQPPPPTPAPAAPAPPSSGDSASVIDAIKQLGSLHDAGILSDDEFTTKKGELLARL